MLCLFKLVMILYHQVKAHRRKFLLLTSPLLKVAPMDMAKTFHILMSLPTEIQLTTDLSEKMTTSTTMSLITTAKPMLDTAQLFHQLTLLETTF